MEATFEFEDLQRMGSTISFEGRLLNGTDHPVVLWAVWMPGSHVLGPRLDVVQGEGEVAVVGQAIQGFWPAVLRTQVFSQAG